MFLTLRQVVISILIQPELISSAEELFEIRSKRKIKDDA